VGTGDVLAELDLNDLLYSITFSYSGDKIATTCKDKFLRVHNARTLEVLKQGKAHAGSKASQAVFTKDDKIFTTGFSRMSDRQYALWAMDGPNAIDGEDGPMTIEDIDTSNGVMFIFYDPDTNVVFLAGKGDSVIRYFEIVETEPYVHWLSNYSSNVPQRGIGYMPKRGVNVNICEIARMFKLAQGSGNQGGYCEPVAFTVPRKSELYQDDLYPDTFSGEASLDAEEWFTQGKNATPKLMSLRENFADSGMKKAKVRASVLTAGKKPAAAASTPAAAPAAKKPAATSLAAPSSGSGEAPAVSVSAANGGEAQSGDVAALTKEVESLTATVKTYGERIKALEDKLADYENTVLNANQDQ